MVIKRPAGGEAAKLVADVVAEPGAHADAAAARLAVLGARAVPHALAALAPGVPDDAAARLVALLAHLPVSRDTLTALDAALERGPEVVVAAVVDALGGLLAAPDTGVATHALDRLTALALDGTRPDDVRAAATRLVAAVLGDEPRARLLERLAAEGSERVRTAATSAPPSSPVDEDPFSPQAGPEALTRHVGRVGATAPLPELHRLVVLARDRESRESHPERRAAWFGARAVAHQVLGERGSTVALYDLRELMASATGPLPVPALSALAALGDATCVDAMAEAYDRIDDAWTRGQLSKVLAAMAGRLEWTRRSPALKRLVERGHPLAGALPTGRKRSGK